MSSRTPVASTSRLIVFAVNLVVIVKPLNGRKIWLVGILVFRSRVKHRHQTPLETRHAIHHSLELFRLQHHRDVGLDARRDDAPERSVCRVGGAFDSAESGYEVVDVRDGVAHFLELLRCELLQLWCVVLVREGVDMNSVGLD